MNLWTSQGDCPYLVWQQGVPVTTNTIQPTTPIQRRAQITDGGILDWCMHNHHKAQMSSHIIGQAGASAIPILPQSSRVHGRQVYCVRPGQSEPFPPLLSFEHHLKQGYSPSEAAELLWPSPCLPTGIPERSTYTYIPCWTNSQLRMGSQNQPQASLQHVINESCANHDSIA